jgi:putative two-component system response regulator
VKSILIVDDNLVSLKQISAQLTQVYEVSLAKSGELALRICAQERPDLILLDVEMPGMDGFETISRLKDDPRLKDIPVIFLTGNNDSATEVKCLESGAMDFIAKPANSDILRHRVELHLQFSTYQRSLEHMVKELEDNIGISFAELLDCKDYNAAGHVLRTGEYAGMLAREIIALGIFGGEITEEDAATIKRAAPFHDIGKIGVSDIILLKRTPLTEEERLEIQKHTLIGGKVLKAIYDRSPNQKYLEMAISIAEGHHERYDGAGYPRGLKGENIPLCCRIMSVVNVYDACVTDKVYRKGLSHEETCKIILDGRGAEFDPKIVDVFEKMQNRLASFRAASAVTTKEQSWGILQ